MLAVTNLNGQTEALNNYNRFEMEQEVNGTFIVALTSFFVANNPGHALLEEESIIHVDGYDFRVKQMRESGNRKEVVGISTFFDLAATWKEDIYGGTRSFDDFAAFAFQETGWTYENVDLSGMRYIPNFGGNVVTMTLALCAAYECEYQILPGNVIQFAEQIGPDNDAQYRYAHNVRALSRSVDTTKLRTKIVAHGADGLQVTYTSPNVDKFGELYAEPISDERFTISDNLLEKARQALIDYPEISLELDTIELIDKDLGEMVWLIYEPMGIEFQTRVLAKKSVERNGRIVTASVTIGNAKPQSLEDMLVQQKIEVDENARQTRSRIEQTNEAIELAVERFAGEILEAYSKIELTADEIRAEVVAMNEELEDGIANNRSLITQTAADIRSEVSSNIERLDGSIENLSSSISQTAREIRSEISAEIQDINGDITSANSAISQLADSVSSVVSTTSNLGGRMSSAESSISQQAAAISSKVEITDFNGTNIVSKINQTPYSVEIDAAHINLIGAVSVLSDITGNLGTITSGNINIYNDINVGAAVNMRGSNRTGIYFGSWSQVYDNGGYLTVEGYNGLSIVGRTTFYSTVDFSRVSVIGLPTNPITFRYSAASKRLYVDQYGSNVGFVSLT